jgi:hypothetical protein
MRRWVERLLERNEAWAFVCIAVFMAMGYVHGPLWLAIIGGALFGTPSLLRMLLMVRDARVPIPLSRKLVSFYLGTVGNGVAAAVAGFFMGWGIRAYWGVFP